MEKLRLALKAVLKTFIKTASRMALPVIFFAILLLLITSVFYAMIPKGSWVAMEAAVNSLKMDGLNESRFDAQIKSNSIKTDGAYLMVPHEDFILIVNDKEYTFYNEPLTVHFNKTVNSQSQKATFTFSIPTVVAASRAELESANFSINEEFAWHPSFSNVKYIFDLVFDNSSTETSEKKATLFTLLNGSEVAISGVSEIEQPKLDSKILQNATIKIRPIISDDFLTLGFYADSISLEAIDEGFVNITGNAKSLDGTSSNGLGSLTHTHLNKQTEYKINMSQFSVDSANEEMLGIELAFHDGTSTLIASGLSKNVEIGGNKLDMSIYSFLIENFGEIIMGVFAVFASLYIAAFIDRNKKEKTENTGK
jgi:hypothetical protein